MLARCGRLQPQDVERDVLSPDICSSDGPDLSTTHTQWQAPAWGDRTDETP